MIRKEFKRKQNQLIKECIKGLNRYFPKVTNSHRVYAKLFILYLKGSTNKTIAKYHPSYIRKAQTLTKFGHGDGEKGSLCTWSGKVNWC